MLSSSSSGYSLWWLLQLLHNAGSDSCNDELHWVSGNGCINTCSDSNGSLTDSKQSDMEQQWLLESVSHTFSASGDSWLSRWFTRGWQDWSHHCCPTNREGHSRGDLLLSDRDPNLFFSVFPQLHISVSTVFYCSILLFQINIIFIPCKNTILYTIHKIWHIPKNNDSVTKIGVTVTNSTNPCEFFKTLQFYAITATAKIERNQKEKQERYALDNNMKWSVFAIISSFKNNSAQYVNKLN